MTHFESFVAPLSNSQVIPSFLIHAMNTIVAKSVNTSYWDDSFVSLMFWDATYMYSYLVGLSIIYMDTSYIFTCFPYKMLFKIVFS